MLCHVLSFLEHPSTVFTLHILVICLSFSCIFHTFGSTLSFADIRTTFSGCFTLTCFLRLYSSTNLFPQPLHLSLSWKILTVSIFSLSTLAMLGIADHLYLSVLAGTSSTTLSLCLVCLFFSATLNHSANLSCSNAFMANFNTAFSLLVFRSSKFAISRAF